MTNIEKSGSLHFEDIDSEHFLTSLLKLALERELLSESQFNSINDRINAEIARVIVKASKGKSSSVRSEVALTIAESVAYTISIALKKEPTPELALLRLKNDSALNIFLEGERIISTKLKYIKQIYSLIKKEQVVIENDTYNGFLPAIVGFIREYDPDYTAHFTHITADYPVAFTIENIVGVEFIAKYIEAFYYENKLLSLLGADKIRILLSEKAASGSSVYNIFTAVFKIAALRIISDMPLIGAPLSPSDKSDLIALLSTEALKAAKESIYRELKIKEGGAKNYADFCFENYIIGDLEKNKARAFIFSAFG